MKKYECPEVMFCQMRKHDVIATSDLEMSEETTTRMDGKGRKNPIWDED